MPGGRSSRSSSAIGLSKIVTTQSKRGNQSNLLVIGRWWRVVLERRRSSRLRVPILLRRSRWANSRRFLDKPLCYARPVGRARKDPGSWASSQSSVAFGQSPLCSIEIAKCSIVFHRNRKMFHYVPSKSQNVPLCSMLFWRVTAHSPTADRQNRLYEWPPSLTSIFPRFRRLSPKKACGLSTRCRFSESLWKPEKSRISTRQPLANQSSNI
jgi:hypothetical protein